MNHDSYDDSYIGILKHREDARDGRGRRNTQPSELFRLQYLLERGSYDSGEPGLAGQGAALEQKVYARSLDIPEPVDMVDTSALAHVVGIVEQALCFDCARR